MLQPKKMFKVVCAIDKKNGGHFWTKCGVAYTNRDDSINVYLDVIPKNWQFQIRAFDEAELLKMNERREQRSSTTGNGLGGSAGGSFQRELPPPGVPPFGMGSAHRNEDIPF